MGDKASVRKTVQRAGDGLHFPQPGDRVEVKYVGKLEDGKVFDSSGDGFFEFTTGIGQVIAGWDEGVKMMSLGEKGTIHVPAEMAYGAEGVQGKIPPNADLVFEVELLKIWPANGGPPHVARGTHGGCLAQTYLCIMSPCTIA